ncbi:general secretion pathway protein GspF [Aliiglaciecola sp. CAU 1673]|uniref:general secretion pathway protein GspF n=1 Tax=Aliiglaciecola sp. CAU 1673 TaxID=3032595 RepID=UPI0023DC14F6|nr:general secretion pathway protein GspF [Aliiglaciecola sp. CAU 1673]MDF2177867.1 general secretion pathway protein GspF [Aliiglaciecola sp. CAU 1673]
MARFIRKQAKPGQALDTPLYLEQHGRPMTRRDFLAQGFRAGAATVMAGSVLSLFANPRNAHATLSADLEALKASCGIATQGAGKIPFIVFDLAGGANIAGSNVLIGGRGGQLDFLSTAGYGRQGLPGDMVPSIANPQTGLSDFINTELGLAFHSDSAFLRGILEKVGVGNRALINGAVIPARSENDTGNNPHNPMYGINKAGADGSLLTLIGSRNSDSGGNSMAPAQMIDPALRPTKVDRPGDVTGLVDTGDLIGLLSQQDSVAVMESIQRISDMKLGRTSTGVQRDEVIKDLVRCGYVKSADIADRFGDPSSLNPELDPLLVGDNGIFTRAEFDGDGEFRKTASVAKLVINGFAGAGTITMGGYDYHDGSRATGELRDLRAGRCMGACLEYAARVGVPLMLYVCSDGSVFSNGMLDDSANGRGKGVWTGDNSATAASFFLVYNPGSRPQLLGATADTQARHQQLGFMRPDGSVETAANPAANNVNLLVETVVLNYLALHGEQGRFSQLFPTHGLGNATLMDSLTAFAPIVQGRI